MIEKVFTEEQVREATSEYYAGDQLATNVFLKYALHKEPDVFVEKTPDDMHVRMAREIERIESKFPNSLKYGPIYDQLYRFKKIVPQGSPMFGIGNPYQIVSLSNCVVIEPPKDTMSGIMDTSKDMANLFKRRCGVGTDLGTLRPEGSLVNNSAGTSTGAWSFANHFSETCRLVGQRGRRGALMLTMPVEHPDIYQFVTMKEDDTKVTGANVSVRLSKEFMEAVKSDSEFLLRWPVNSENPKYSKKVWARDLWDTIIKQARDNAEPGLLFWDAVKEYMPADCYPEFVTVSTNPCSEIPLSANDSCRLTSINLKNFVVNPFRKRGNDKEENSWIDYEELETTVRTTVRLLDDLIELEVEALDKIIKASDEESEKRLFKKLKNACLRGRRVGLGTHGLADMLARMQYKYDTDEAISFVDSLYEKIKIWAYDESVNLAIERGVFPAFDWELEKHCKFYDSFPDWLLKRMERHGRRHVSILTCAPTGSVSILSQTSSGIEPVFANFLIRRRKIDHTVEKITPDFIDKLGDAWIEFEVLHENVREYIEMFGGTTKDLPDYFVTAPDIDWIQRVKMQRAMQKHIDHAISSTINLPKDVTEEKVGEIYLAAWEHGLKGVTVYREGSRSGVLLTSKQENQSYFLPTDAPKRPESLPVEVHIMPRKQAALVGIMGDSPYELMVVDEETLKGLDLTQDISLIKYKVFKTRETRYDLLVGEQRIKEVQRDFILPDVTRLVSLSLRHGAKPSYIVEQLGKTSKDFFSDHKNIARVLKTYIDDGEEVSGDKVCSECNEPGLVYMEGCETCMNCGHAKCG